jgi:long-chain fatty acid transport protein
MASVFAQASDNWAVLGSIGWQQWSRFGEVQIGIESNNPQTVTADLNFTDTWHGAVGAQYRINEPWMLNFGVAYDSSFQDGSTVSPALPADSAWRFGLGAQVQTSKTVGWGFAAEYVYGGSLDVNEQAQFPVALGGRGDLVGSYNDLGMFFLAGNLDLKF